MATPPYASPSFASHKNHGTSSVCAWVDLETTQLDPAKGHILEIAVIITTGFELRELKRLHIVVHHDATVFDDMSEWCQEQHRKPRPSEAGRSLIDLCRGSSVTLRKAEKLLGDFLDHFRQGKWIIMWGSSIRLDYDFLTRHMPSMKRRLHYRLGDVSSVMETCKRFYPGLRLPAVDVSHCAMDDVEASLRLLRWLRRTCFVALPQFMFHEDESAAKTFRWGFDAVGGHAVPSSLDYLDTVASVLGAGGGGSHCGVGGVGGGFGGGSHGGGFGGGSHGGGGGGGDSSDPDPSSAASSREACLDKDVRTLAAACADALKAILRMHRVE